MVEDRENAPERRAGPILVVDDEPALLRLIEQYLTRRGYEVEICSTARQALERFSASPGRFPLVLADWMLPDMSGQELLSGLLALNASVRVLLCSGYPPNPFGLPEAAQSQVRFLQKPFLPHMLAEAVGELLGGAPAGS